MDYLPIFLSIRERRVLVVGGGPVAARKVDALLKAGARVSVVARQLLPQLQARVALGELEHLPGEFLPGQLAGAALAVAATDDPRVNAAVSRAAQQRQIPVNVVDQPALSTFIFPAIVDRSPLVVAIGTAGSSPVLARRVRARIEALLPGRLGALARFMHERRDAVRRSLAAPARRAFWERIADGAVASRVLAGDETAADGAFERSLGAARRAGGGGDARGEVYLIGAGPGDPDLLTLRALQLLQCADVVLYDRLVGPQVLERARRDAELIFVGKAAGEHRQQERIHELLLQHAQAGKRVVRLKGGDPFVFGRGGEELELLAAHGIPCTVVPGITAALGAAAGAALPLTHRRLAHSLTLVNGHQGAGEVEPDWPSFADPRHTVVFYMGLGSLAGIVARLRAAGAAPGHPAALIARATLPEQEVVRGTLGDIVDRAAARNLPAPALFIIGACAAFDAARQDEQAMRPRNRQHELRPRGSKALTLIKRSHRGAPVAPDEPRSLPEHALEPM